MHVRVLVEKPLVQVFVLLLQSTAKDFPSAKRTIDANSEGFDSDCGSVLNCFIDECTHADCT